VAEAPLAPLLYDNQRRPLRLGQRGRNLAPLAGEPGRDRDQRDQGKPANPRPGRHDPTIQQPLPRGARVWGCRENLPSSCSRQPAMKPGMTRALMAALLLAIPLLTSWILVRRVPHPVRSDR
jgi:hypothetical protein